jgi:hypothetical protein
VREGCFAFARLLAPESNQVHRFTEWADKNHLKIFEAARQSPHSVRDAVADRQAVQDTETLLRSVLGQLEGSAGAQHLIRDLAAKAPEVFFLATMSLLEEATESPVLSKPYVRLIACPEFLLQLIAPNRLSLKKLVEVCRRLLRIDQRLDIRLAHLVPGRHQDDHNLSPELIERILLVLHQVSDGPRLILMLSHLTQHPAPQIAGQAITLVVGRVCNIHWVKRHLGSSDPRVRASVIEGLWGIQTAAARRTMVDGVNDANHRVVGNSVYGLHLLGDAGAAGRAVAMLRDPRPKFRATAAWLMGKIAQQEFAELLRNLASDSDMGVRGSAKRALGAIRQAFPSQPALAALPQTPPQPPIEVPIEVPETAVPEPAFQIHLDGTYAHRDH